jgi:phosphatidylinositol alpha-1,6-mannosyltransferase
LILLLQSTTFGAYGGIPTYNRVVCRVLNELAEPIERRVFIVTDTPCDLDSHQSEFPNLTFSAFSRRRSAFILQVVRLILTRKIDLLLIGHVNYAPLGLLLRLLRPSLRYGVMVHGVDVWSQLSPIKRRALEKADFVSSVSEYTKKKVVSVNGVDAERVYILPNALEWQECAEEAAVAPRALTSATRLLSVCRLSVDEGYKGVDTVIEALPTIVGAVPDVEYFVIGNGTDLERHKLLAQQHSVSDRVHFLGSVDVDTLKANYEACDIFVMPSAGEGFGIVFLEAMRYSKPVVAADSGAVAEVVQDGATGELVPYGNRERLAESLISLCLDPAKRAQMGNAGYQRLQDNFTFQHFNEKLSAILRQQMPVTEIGEAGAGVTERTIQTP